jgi:hypothetical protein
MPKKTEVEDVKSVSVDASKSNKKVTNKVVAKKDIVEDKPVVEEKPKKGGKKVEEPVKVEVVEQKSKRW